MTPPEVQKLARSLARAGAEAQRMAAEVEDLHVLATERPRTGEQSRRTQPGPRDPATGSPRAKAAMRRLDSACTDLIRAVADAQDLLHAGPPPESLRGSLLGSDDGTGVRAELSRLRAAQRRRRDRGEYVPHRDWPQPSGPGR